MTRSDNHDHQESRRDGLLRRAKAAATRAQHAQEDVDQANAVAAAHQPDVCHQGPLEAPQSEASRATPHQPEGACHEEEHGICRLREETEQNVVQILFETKPNDEARALIKRAGFRWSPKARAWQQLLDDSGRCLARAVITELKRREDA